MDLVAGSAAFLRGGFRNGKRTGVGGGRKGVESGQEERTEDAARLQARSFHKIGGAKFAARIVNRVLTERDMHGKIIGQRKRFSGPGTESIKPRIRSYCLAANFLGGNDAKGNEYRHAGRKRRSMCSMRSCWNPGNSIRCTRRHGTGFRQGKKAR